VAAMSRIEGAPTARFPSGVGNRGEMRVGEGDGSSPRGNDSNVPSVRWSGLATSALSRLQSNESSRSSPGHVETAISEGKIGRIQLPEVVTTDVSMRPR